MTNYILYLTYHLIAVLNFKQTQEHLNLYI